MSATGWLDRHRAGGSTNRIWFTMDGRHRDNPDPRSFGCTSLVVEHASISAAGERFGQSGVLSESESGHRAADRLLVSCGLGIASAGLDGCHSTGAVMAVWWKPFCLDPLGLQWTTYLRAISSPLILSGVMATGVGALVFGTAHLH